MFYNTNTVLLISHSVMCLYASDDGPDTWQLLLCSFPCGSLSCQVPLRTSIKPEEVLAKPGNSKFHLSLKEWWCCHLMVDIKKKKHTAVLPNSKYAVPVTHPLAPITTRSIHLSLRFKIPAQILQRWLTPHAPLWFRCESFYSFTINVWITGTL